MESLNISNSVAIVCHFIDQAVNKKIDCKFFSIINVFKCPHSSIGRAIDL